MNFDEIAKACSRELVSHLSLHDSSQIPKRPWLPEIYYFAARHTDLIEFEDEIAKLFYKEVISKYLTNER